MRKMRSLFSSTLAAVALALPLGVGGLILAAPLSATDAVAQTAIEHWFDTCGQDTITRCAYEHRTYIWTNGDNFGYKSGRGNLPYASNGADYKAFDYLKNRIESGTLTDIQQEFWEAAFNRFFPDGVRPPPPMLTEEELQEAHDRLTFQNSPGQTTVEQITNFNNRCEQQGGLPTQRFQFGELDVGANQCRIEAEVPNDDPNAEPVTISETADFRLDVAALDPEDPVARLLREMGDHLPGPLFQVNKLDPFDPAANPNPFAGDTDQAGAVNDHRGRIIELQGEFEEHDEAIQSMLQTQTMHASSIREHTASIAALNTSVQTNTDDIAGLLEDVETNTGAIADLDEDVQSNTAALSGLLEEMSKNTAGVALALALDSQPLHFNKTFAITGGFGNFSSETGFGVSFTGRFAENMFGNIGAGFAGSGDSSVNGLKGSVSFQW